MHSVGHRRLRTTTGLERLDKELTRRNRIAKRFSNQALPRLLASAVLSETHDDRERAHLTMEARCPASEDRHVRKMCSYTQCETRHHVCSGQECEACRPRPGH